MPTDKQGEESKAEISKSGAVGEAGQIWRKQETDAKLGETGKKTWALGHPRHSHEI